MTVYAHRQGGFGNQMFQLAAAIGLDEQGDGRLLLLEDEVPLMWHLARRLMTPRITAEDHRRANRVPPELRFEQPSEHLADAFQPPPDFVERPQRIVGYFQHPGWYSAALPALVDAALASAPRRLMASPTGRPVLNVRGGDYAPLGWMLPTSYYVAARAAVPLDGAITITDDDERGAVIAAVLTAAGTAVEPPGTSGSVNDFWAMVATPTLVMSNSTFTWWAAHVGDELYRRAGLQRTVIFPKQWILGEGSVLCASHWIAV